MKLRHIIKKEHGQAMVEFALVLPILLLLVGGIIDFGWIFFNQISVNNASREAARYVAIHYTEADINKTINKAKIEAREKVSENILSSFEVVEVEVIPDVTPYDPSNPTEADYITVSLKGNVIVLTPILQSILSDKYEISANTTMRVEK